MDKIFYNGDIETMAGRRASAVAIAGDRIAYVGSDEGALKLAGPQTQAIDLKGAFVVPGFTDSHIHTLNTAQDQGRLDLRGVSSVEEIVERGKAYIAERNLPQGEWVVGWGFNHNTFDEVRLPSKEDLDSISTAHPILAVRVCGHIATANSLALEAGGVTKDTVIEGGEIDLGADGEVTGVLRETAIGGVYGAMPGIDAERAAEMLASVTASMAKAGLTAVHSDDFGSIGGWENLYAAVKECADKGELKLRIYEECNCSSPKDVEHLANLGIRSGVGDGDLRAVNVKIVADGSLGAGTAYMLDDYADAPGERGIPIYSAEELAALVTAAHNAGFNVACHCIGDATLAMYLDAVEAAQAANPKPLKHRVVHCQIGSRALYERMAALNVGADIQPPFTATDWPIVAARVGEAKEKESYAWKTLLDMGIRLEGGSDSPVEPFDPIWGIFCAVTRSDRDGSEAWLPEERLTVNEAIALYTTGPAYFAGSEADTGTIAAGKYADMAVLDASLYEVKPEAIKDVKVRLTIKGGQVTYTDGTLV